MSTKQEVLNDVSELLGIQKFTLAPGSSEPKEFLVAVIYQLGIDASDYPNTKPGLARAIVESFGHTWHPEFSSTGSTVTLKGLQAILDIIRVIKP